jgi:hypothetical protein
MKTWLKCAENARFWAENALNLAEKWLKMAVLAAFSALCLLSVQ